MLYFMLNPDSDDMWALDDELQVFVCIDDDPEKEPPWKDVKPVFDAIGLVPDYQDNFSSECTVCFKREDQKPDIQSKSLEELQSYLGDQFRAHGWVESTVDEDDDEDDEEDEDDDEEDDDEDDEEDEDDE